MRLSAARIRILRPYPNAPEFALSVPDGVNATTFLCCTAGTLDLGPHSRVSFGLRVLLPHEMGGPVAMPLCSVRTG